jgi:hypothetical protein
LYQFSTCVPPHCSIIRTNQQILIKLIRTEDCIPVTSLHNGIKKFVYFSFNFSCSLRDVLVESFKFYRKMEVCYLTLRILGLLSWYIYIYIYIYVCVCV